MLEDDPELEVVGEGSDGPQAEELARQLKPDVIVLDYALPGQNGALTARKILAVQPTVKILILSMHSEPGYVTQSREAGATGYLLKNALDLELVQAVKQVLQGEWVQDPRLSQAASATVGKRLLTTRELEVLQFIVAGRSNKEIAARLVISPKTTGNHIQHIYTKIGTSNRAGASLFAVRQGLLPEEGFARMPSIDCG